MVPWWVEAGLGLCARALVCTLLFVCGPATVGLRVRLVVVDAVEGEALGTDAHVLDKGIEVEPARVHSDAASSVPVVVLVLDGGAAPDHGVPAAVGRVLVLGVALGPRERLLRGAICALVAGRWRVGGDAGVGDFPLEATVTAADPGERWPDLDARSEGYDRTVVGASDDGDAAYPASCVVLKYL